MIRTVLNLRPRVQNERYLPGVQLALLFLTMHLISLMHILFHFLPNFYTKMSHTTLNSRTTKRVQTFYDGQPTSPPGVCHIPMAEPFCNKTREVGDNSQLSVSPTPFLFILPYSLHLFHTSSCRFSWRLPRHSV